MYTVEHYSSGGPNSSSQNFHQHQHQHQHQHCETESSAVQFTPIVNTLPGIVNTQTTYEVEERIEPPTFRIHHHHRPLGHYETHHEMKEISQTGGSAIFKQEKHEKSKKTVQTTTTSASGAPIIIEETYVNEVHHPLNEKNYEITVQHYPAKKRAFNWPRFDTYLHIFLTFWFGHFAAVLFFDGVLRNFAFLYILEHTYLSTTVYVVHILFSVALIVFTLWLVSVCWRWWRHKSSVAASAETTDESGGGSGSAIRVRPHDRQADFGGYVLIAAIVLIVGFACYVVLGLLDLSFKKKQDYKHYGNYNPSAYMCDIAVFVFRLVFWLVGIVATLMLSRERLYKYCCPSKQIKIGKERPVTVYQVNA